MVRSCTFPTPQGRSLRIHNLTRVCPSGLEGAGGGLVSTCALYEVRVYYEHTLMLMSLSSTNSTVCPGERSRLPDKSEVLAGTLREGESEASVSSATPPVSCMIGSDFIAVGFGVKGSLIWSLDSSTSA